MFINVVCYGDVLIVWLDINKEDYCVCIDICDDG